MCPELNAFSAPNEKPEGLATERISARSADIIWQRVSPPLNGSIDGYKVRELTL